MTESSSLLETRFRRLSPRYQHLSSDIAGIPSASTSNDQRSCSQTVVSGQTFGSKAVKILGIGEELGLPEYVRMLQPRGDDIPLGDLALVHIDPERSEDAIKLAPDLQRSASFPIGVTNAEQTNRLSFDGEGGTSHNDLSSSSMPLERSDREASFASGNLSFADAQENNPVPGNVRNSSPLPVSPLNLAKKDDRTILKEHVTHGGSASESDDEQHRRMVTEATVVELLKADQRRTGTSIFACDLEKGLGWPQSTEQNVVCSASKSEKDRHALSNFLPPSVSEYLEASYESRTFRKLQTKLSHAWKWMTGLLQQSNLMHSRKASLEADLSRVDSKHASTKLRGVGPTCPVDGPQIHECERSKLAQFDGAYDVEIESILYGHPKSGRADSTAHGFQNHSSRASARSLPNTLKGFSVVLPVIFST